MRQTAANWSWTWVHRDSLHQARNDGAAALASKCNWLLFLDADDELDTGYVAAMTTAALAVNAPCILRPATLGIVDGVEDAEPVLIERADLRHANYIVIAAMVPATHFFAVGGFDAYPILEDWALWLKLAKAGLPVVDVPQAVYRIHVRSESRNTNLALHARIYAEIRARHGG
jgi:GT2 family glycosyltransferase